MSAHIHQHLRVSVFKKRKEAVPINIVASIESARALVNIREIASWQSDFGPVLGGKLSALLVYIRPTIVTEPDADPCSLVCGGGLCATFRSLRATSILTQV